MEISQHENVELKNRIKSNILLLLQLNDSAFPTGAFTHSLGFEASVQRHHVTDKHSLQNFVIAILENVGSSSLPYVKEAHQLSNDVLQLKALDRHFIATHSNHAANRASRQQGRSFLHASGQAFDLPLHRELQSMIESNQMQGFQEVIFGAVFASLGVSLYDTLQCFLFSTLRTVVTSVVRLGKILGTMEAQAFQFNMQKLIPTIIERNMDRSTDEVCLKHPSVDLIQCSHDTLFSRLFYS